MDSGLWQLVWVDREQRKPGSVKQQHGRIEEVAEVSMGLETTLAGKLRQLRLDERDTYPQTLFMRVINVGSLLLNLLLGEVREYVVQELEDGVIQSWVEAKRIAEELNDSIIVAARDAMRN